MLKIIKIPLVKFRKRGIFYQNHKSSVMRNTMITSISLTPAASAALADLKREMCTDNTSFVIRYALIVAKKFHESTQQQKSQK